MKEESGTSLDALYDLLQERKIMSVEDIAAHFSVGTELVMEWGKVLEAGELATISTPRMGKPVIKLAGYTGEEPKGEQPKEEKEAEVKQKLEEQKEKAREDIIDKNKLIRNRNKGKINEAKKIMSEARKRGYDNEYIKQMFVDKGWPQKLVDELLSQV
jgi:hypothetical protein